MLSCPSRRPARRGTPLSADERYFLLPLRVHYSVGARIARHEGFPDAPRRDFGAVLAGGRRSSEPPAAAGRPGSGSSWRGPPTVERTGLAGAKLFEIPREQVSERYEILRLGGGGAPATVVCGVFQFDHPAAHQLVSILPRMIIIEVWNSPHMDWIQSTLRAMAAEASELRPGGETVITRLADILVIHVIRSWIAQDPAAQTGWLGALQDKQIGRVISRIHREPERAWSLESLASDAAMSRSAFAARFTELVGEPAMHYVTRWRMHLALTWLQEDNMPVGDLSRRLGYESEAAFNRAFKRHIGLPPGAARRNKDVARRTMQL